jgi:serine/threonine protein phosphatase PrpC
MLRRREKGRNEQRGMNPHELFERETNQGEPALSARVELGSEQRKSFPEVSKINRPDLGLFLIAQGSGDGEMGRLASYQAMQVVYDRLGGALDEKTKNIRHTHIDENDKMHHMDVLIRAEIKQVFQCLRDQLQRLKTMMSDSKRIGVRPSVVKHMEMSDGSQRLYIGGLGDNRVYLHRGGTLHQLTEDDTSFTNQKSYFTPEQLHRIDQASSPDILPSGQKKVFALREDVLDLNTEEDYTEPIRVQSFDVKSGDRVLMVNGGVQHNVLTKELQGLMNRNLDDTATERIIQGFADHETRSHHPRGRAEASDLAVISFTVPEGRISNSIEKGSQELLSATLQEEISSYQKNRDRALRALHILDEQIRRLPSETLLRNRLVLQRERTQMAQQEANDRYQLAVSKLSLLDIQIPPRLCVGETVFVSESDEEEKMTQGKILDYDNSTNRYVVSGPQGEVQMTRAQLELIQPKGIRPHNGDLISLIGGETPEQYLFEVQGLTEDGFVEFLAQTEKGTLHKRCPLDNVVDVMTATLIQSETIQTDKKRAQQEYWKYHRFEKQLETRLNELRD